MRRLIQNLTTGAWHLRKAISISDRYAITNAVREAEKGTSAQIKVVIESSLHVMDVFRGQTARERALEVFGIERVWDTCENNGILLYLLLAEQDAEIVTDRGFNDKVDETSWRHVCSLLESEHSSSSFARAVCIAVAELGKIAHAVFPSSTGVNEIPDEVRVR